MELDSSNYPLQMNIHYFSEISPMRRKNQDNFYVCGHANFFSESFVADSAKAATQVLQAIALFDGMGGGTSGERASLVAAETMDTFLSSIGEDLHQESILKASQKYYASFMEKIDNYLGDDTSVCGTTFVGVFLQNRHLIPAWLGDSRAYLLRGKTLYRLTKDHSLAQLNIDQGSISEEEAKNTHDWHVLTEYMGKGDATFSVGNSIMLRPGDKVLLCSDGITDRYTDDELFKILSMSSRHSIQALVKMAQTEAADNCTAIIIDIGNASLCSMANNLSRRATEWYRTFKLKTK